MLLKALETFDNVKNQYSHSVYLNMHTITNLWTFCAQLLVIQVAKTNNERKNAFVAHMGAFRCLRKRLQACSLSQIHFSENIPLSRKLNYLRRSRFSHNVLKSTAHRCSLYNTSLSSNYQTCPAKDFCRTRWSGTRCPYWGQIFNQSGWVRNMTWPIVVKGGGTVLRAKLIRHLPCVPIQKRIHYKTSLCAYRLQ